MFEYPILPVALGKVSVAAELTAGAAMVTFADPLELAVMMTSLIPHLSCKRRAKIARLEFERIPAPNSKAQKGSGMCNDKSSLG
ncbi:MAG: hypothetical protein EBZ78_09330 [Verrucomicrobia bacterium]|nr:hypothetical protein [Verrucomicrobiota bacterium]